jgi:predicted RNase H-like HicB family nuclease
MDGHVGKPRDFDIDAQGKDLPEVVSMARDAIGLMGIDMQDDGKTLPMPSDPYSLRYSETEILSVIDIDFDEYRRANDQRTVRRNVSLPSWLDEKATRSGINVSAILKDALLEKLASS